MEANLWEAATRLEPLSPAFVSVTYGAGGSTRERTHSLVERIARETTMKPAAHLTCVGASRDDIRATLRAYRSAGVRHVVAFRGDPPTGFDALYEAASDGYQSTAKLVADARGIADFEVSVGTYTKRHPQSATLLHDIEILKRKVDAGATRAITQFFFDNSVYFRFLDVAAAAGLKVPIVPGVFPGAELQADRQFRPQGRGERAAMAGRPVRRARGRSGDPSSRGGGGLRRAGDRSHRPRRRGTAFLHHEPRRSRLCDLPPGRPKGEARAGRDRRRRPGTAFVAASVVRGWRRSTRASRRRVSHRPPSTARSTLPAAKRPRPGSGFPG